MRFGVCRPYTDAAMVKAAGFDYIEPALCDIAALSDEEFSVCRQTLQAANIKAEACNGFFPENYPLVGPDVDIHAIMGYTKKAVARAHALGCETLVLAGGKNRTIREDWDRETCEAQFVEIVRAISKVLEDYGILLVVEPLNRKETNFVNTVMEGSKISGRINRPNVRSMVNFYHHSTVGCEPWELFGARSQIAYLHVARNNPDRMVPYEEDEEQVRQWAAFVCDIAYDGRLSLEGNFRDFEADAASVLERVRVFENYRYDTAVNEDMIQITSFELAGKLPNPFIYDDGTAVTKPEEWAKRRAEMYKTAVELQYGTLPPKPEVLEVLASGNAHPVRNYLIKTGPKDHPFYMEMAVMAPDGPGPFPVAIDGDRCFQYPWNQEFIRSFTDNGVALALFNRTMLMPDRQDMGRVGMLVDAYPEYTFGEIGAWAWGYMRCVDALQDIPFIDKNCIAVVGHSRGGKAALLAGACDERVAIVNPNEACAGGSSCYRLRVTAVREDGLEPVSEQLEDMFKNFPYWFNPALKEYIGREQDLPFDSHYLKAMVAPRVLIDGEAASDIWGNPIGSYLTTMAAKEVFKFLGVEDNVYWYNRKGFHFHKIEDVKRLVNVIRHRYYGDELADGFFTLPFKAPKLIHDWKCPTI